MDLAPRIETLGCDISAPTIMGLTGDDAAPSFGTAHLRPIEILPVKGELSETYIGTLAGPGAVGQKLGGDRRSP